MKLKNFGYSLKNIPIPSKPNYLKCMIEKVESFVKRLRWKAFYFCKEKEKPENKPQNLFGFKSPTTPPQNGHLNSFENVLYNLIQSIEFKTVKNKFLNKLQKDVENIRSSKNMLVFADKSTSRK